MSLIYTFQILKAPRKSIRFPDPEQQENVVGILLDFFFPFFKSTWISLFKKTTTFWLQIKCNPLLGTSYRYKTLSLTLCIIFFIALNVFMFIFT